MFFMCPRVRVRTFGAIEDEPVAPVRDRLVRELKHLVYREKEFAVSVGRSSQGTFLEVLHIPTGKKRRIDPVGRRSQGALREDMIDDILEEIFRRARSSVIARWSACLPLIALNQGGNHLKDFFPLTPW